MSPELLAGSAAAAYAAGLIAFFAPCCAAVMTPTYIAAIGQGSRWRVARMTALYVAGVAVVVWPITLGAGALSTLITRWHPLLFALGGLMMIAVAVMLWRGSMLPMALPQPELRGSRGSVFLLGCFSGAATACCAPVLAGAVALSAATGSWTGGALLGGVYILGLISPLLPLAFAWGRLRERVRDPRLTLRLGECAKQITRLAARRHGRLRRLRRPLHRPGAERQRRERPGLPAQPRPLGRAAWRTTSTRCPTWSPGPSSPS